jgi:uncharacterized membrane protein YbhN (UPF0104 family)
MTSSPEPTLTREADAERDAPAERDVPDSGVVPLPKPMPVRLSSVDIVDSPATRLRYPADLLGVLGCAVGMGLVCGMVVLAHNTTAGLTEDVRSFAALLQRLLFLPVALLQTILVLFVPIAVSAELLWRRHGTRVLHILAAGLAGLVVNGVIAVLLGRFAPEALLTGLVIPRTPTMPTMPGQVAATMALLTAAAEPTRRRMVTWSWTLLWITVGVLVITSSATLPGMGLSLLAGSMVGLATRYTVGVTSERAYGRPLIAGIRRAGFDPQALNRVSLISFEDGGPLRPAAQVPQFFADHRLYAMTATDGQEYDVIVLDGDRQPVRVLGRWWRQLRSRAVTARAVTSLRQSAERAALLTYAVQAAGVRTPGVLALAEADDSMILVREPVPVSTNLAELDPAGLDDDLLHAMWTELVKANRAGIVHRSLTDHVFRIETLYADESESFEETRRLGGPLATSQGDALAAGAATRRETGRQLWILGWEGGDVASSDLARRIDLTQLLTLLALKVGSARAIASAARVLGEDELRALGPFLQVPALPHRTRDQIRGRKQLLSELREGLVARVPQAEVAPQQLVRVGARTVITWVLTAVALFIVFTSFNLGAVSAALSRSDWRWALATFVLGLVGVLGAALILIAFAPVRIGVVTAWSTQLAASYVAVSVPAGIGTAGVNLRVLTKRGVSTSLATATAALIQVSQIATTILTLVILTLVTGSNQAAPFQVTPTILVVVVILAAGIGVVFALPGTRTWILGRIRPTLERTWPRLVELVSNPGRLALGLGGNLLMVLGYAAAFQAALMAFGQDLSFGSSSIAYLLGNSAGSAAPTPGGMGAIEAAELAALGAAGINAGVAASVVVVFRVATFWIRIPLGWLMMRALERREVL